jgi:hypothetical protein
LLLLPQCLARTSADDAREALGKEEQESLDLTDGPGVHPR